MASQRPMTTAEWIEHGPLPAVLCVGLTMIALAYMIAPDGEAQMTEGRRLTVQPMAVETVCVRAETIVAKSR
jgi:hypothetical protein